MKSGLFDLMCTCTVRNTFKMLDNKKKVLAMELKMSVSSRPAQFYMIQETHGLVHELNLETPPHCKSKRKKKKMKM